MAKLWHFALAGTLALAGHAHAQAKDTAKTGTQDTMKTDAARTGVVLPADEKAFLEWLHHENQTEVKLGQLAQEKAVSREVKQYGQMLVTEHQDADQKIMAYAKQKNWTLGEWKPQSDADKKVDDAEKANMDKLKSLNGEMFDRTFLADMVADHDTVLAKIAVAQDKYKDVAPVLKPIVPKLEQHREQAYRLLGQMKTKTT